MSAVRRYDASELGRNVRVDERGFLTVPAYVTRIGVFPYRRADGQVVNELRHPEEVFSWDSLSTLGAAPVTDGHPAEFVTPENAQQLEIGVVGSYAGPAGPMVSAELSFRRADAIERVKSGDLAEVSCGYTCEIDPTPGTWNGERYDQVQRRIRYNHVAVGPRGWARLGRDMALRADSADAVLALDELAHRTDSTGPAGEETTMVKIRIDGVDFDAPEQTAAAIAKERERADGAASALKAQVAEQQARADKAEGAVEQLKAQLAAATDPAKRADEIRARVELERSAAKVLGETEKLDGLSDREVRVKVLGKLSPSLKLDGKSDETVLGAFEAAMAAAPIANPGLAVIAHGATGGTTEPARTDADDLEAALARRANAFSANAQKGN